MTRQGIESQNFRLGSNLRARVHLLLNFIAQEPEAKRGISHLCIQGGAGLRAEACRLDQVTDAETEKEP